MTNKQRRKLLYFDNPMAGKRPKIREQALILEALLQYGDLVTFYRCQEDLEFSNLKDFELEEYDLLVTNGGDGTLNLVVWGIEQYKTQFPEAKIPPLIYVPTGSTNDFGRSLGLSFDPVMAIQDSLNGEEVLLDIGMANERPFVYVAAFGAFVETAYETSREMKLALGHLAYLIEGIKSLPTIEPIPARISWNDQVLEDEFIFGAFINSHSVGGILEFDEDIVDLSDGKFELLLIRRAHSQFEYAGVASQILKQAYEHDLLVFEHTDKVLMEFQQPINFTIDGEAGGTSKVWELSVKKEELCLRIPPLMF